MRFRLVGGMVVALKRERVRNMTNAMPAVAMHVTLMLCCVAVTYVIPKIADEEREPMTTESVDISSVSFMGRLFTYYYASLIACRC